MQVPCIPALSLSSMAGLSYENIRGKKFTWSVYRHVALSVYLSAEKISIKCPKVSKFLGHTSMKIRALLFLTFLVAVSHAFSPAAIHLAPRSASASAFTASHRPSPLLGSRHVSNGGLMYGRDRATGLRMAVSLPAGKPLKVGICGENSFLLCSAWNHLWPHTPRNRK